MTNPLDPKTIAENALIVDQKTAAQILQLAPRTINKYLNKPDAPKPIQFYTTQTTGKIGDTNAYFLTEIESYLNNQTPADYTLTRQILAQSDITDLTQALKIITKNLTKTDLLQQIQNQTNTTNPTKHLTNATTLLTPKYTTITKQIQKNPTPAQIQFHTPNHKIGPTNAYQTHKLQQQIQNQIKTHLKKHQTLSTKT